MPRIQPAARSAEYDLTVRLLTEFQQTWQRLYKQENIDAMVFSRFSLVALTQLSAVIAVDVGMSDEQFLSVCKAQFTEAFAKAPRFG